MTRRLLPLTALALLAACSGMPEPVAPAAGPRRTSRPRTPARSRPRRSTPRQPTRTSIPLDLALRRADAPGALPAGLAAVDALVTGVVPGFEGMGPQAIAFRSRAGFVAVSARLGRAYASTDGAPPSATLVILRGYLAAALHELSLFTGDAAAAHTWSARRGCASAATVIGPLDWTPLRGLEDPSPIAATGPLAASYAGMPPFAAAITPAVVYADSCLLDVAGRARSRASERSSSISRCREPRPSTWRSQPRRPRWSTWAACASCAAASRRAASR